MAIASLLDRPEYVHVLINHLPLIGLLVGMVSLGCAIGLKNRGAIFLGLALVALLSLSACVVSYFGEEGYDRVLSMADENGQAFLRYHQHLADRWIFLFYVCAAVALMGIVFGWKWPRWLTPISILTLLLGAGALAAGILIARSGGEIRHREFRSGPPPELPQKQ